MEQLQDRRVWIGGGVITALLVVAAGWFVFISPERDNAAALHDQAVSTRFANTQLQAKVATLRAKTAQIARYSATLRDALEALPADSGLPAFTRQVGAQAKAAKVELVSITVGGIAAATPATTAPTAGATPAPSASPTAASDGTTSTTTATAPDAPSAGSVYSVQVQLVTQGSLARQRAFLNSLQYAGPRRALVSGTQFAPSTGSRVTSIDSSARMTTQLTVFSAPQTPDEMAQLKKLLAGRPNG